MHGDIYCTQKPCSFEIIQLMEVVPEACEISSPWATVLYYVDRASDTLHGGSKGKQQAEPDALLAMHLLGHFSPMVCL